MQKKPVLSNIFFGLIFICLLANAAFAQTTAFAYQGRLTDAGNPASGNYDLQFKLFDTVTVGTGAQQGAMVLVSNVTVTSGIFTVQLDFGACASCFNGSARFLEIAVKPTSGGSFTILAPRQPITSSPYAIQTLNAQQLGGLPASAYVTTASAGNSFIKNDTVQQTGANLNISGNGLFGGNLGIGTPTPQSKLTVQSSGYGLTHTNGTIMLGTFITTAAGGSGSIGTKSNHPLNFFTNDGLAQMTLDTLGNVGIGMTIPTTKLFVLSSTPGLSAIYGESASGRGVWGKSTGSRGVYGESTSLEGVYGISSSGNGVSGASTSGSGVFGQTAVSSPTAGGVYGLGIGNDSLGVIGESNNGNNAVGVYGVTSSANGFGMFARNTAAGGRAIYADGNVAQSLASNGLVKAMLEVDNNGLILRCYNSINNTSSGNCGITITLPLGLDAGIYRIDFGVPISNRFFSVTAKYLANYGANYRVFNSTSVEIFTFNSGETLDTARTFGFMFFMY